MTNIKKFLFGILAISLIGSLAALTACGGTPSNDGNNNDNNNDNTDTEDPVDEGETKYTFEAEYTKLEGLNGFGPSGSPQGTSLAMEATGASNGWCVANLGPESPITFTITSSAETTATLRIRFGNNSLGGTCAWNPETLVISVNDTALTGYSFTTQPDTVPNGQNFTTVNLGEITLDEGENTIVISAGTNTYLINLTTMPSIDYIRLDTTATLTMETYEDNIL